MINKSNILHGIIAVCMQIVIWAITMNPFYGAFLACGLFWGREHDQKQHNIAAATRRKVKDLKWYEGADMTKWSADSLLDFFVPFILTTSIAFAYWYFW